MASSRRLRLSALHWEGPYRHPSQRVLGLASAASSTQAPAAAPGPDAAPPAPRPLATQLPPIHEEAKEQPEAGGAPATPSADAGAAAPDDASVHIAVPPPSAAESGGGAGGGAGIVWHTLPTSAAVYGAARTNEQGLSAEEARTRLTTYGPNEMTAGKKPSLLSKLWAQLNNAVMYILAGAAVIGAIYQDWAEVALIAAVVAINVIIGLIQEGKAERAAEAIKKMLSPNAVVVRDGQRRTVDARDVVPGDVIFVQSGDRVPADARLVSATNLQVTESQLTGESVRIHLTCLPHGSEHRFGDTRHTFSSTTRKTL